VPPKPFHLDALIGEERDLARALRYGDHDHQAVADVVEIVGQVCLFELIEGLWKGALIIESFSGVSEPECDCGDRQHCKIVHRSFLVPGGNAAELLQPVDESLDDVSLAVRNLVEAHPPLSALPSDHDTDPPAPQGALDVPATVVLVSRHPIRSSPWPSTFPSFHDSRVIAGKASVPVANDPSAYSWRAAYTAKLNGVDIVGSRAMRITVPLSASSSITTDPAS